MEYLAAFLASSTEFPLCIFDCTLGLCCGFHISCFDGLRKFVPQSVAMAGEKHGTPMASQRRYAPS